MKTIDPLILNRLKKGGGRWYAYENRDLTSRSLGELEFRTIENDEEPPDRLTGRYSKYLLEGELNLETGEIIGGGGGLDDETIEEIRISNDSHFDIEG